jgi:hypothetical protein
MCDISTTSTKQRRLVAGICGWNGACSGGGWSRTHATGRGNLSSQATGARASLQQARSDRSAPVVSVREEIEGSPRPNLSRQMKRSD